MDKDLCVRQLLAWFGNREFLVRDLDANKVRELTELMELADSNNIGSRSRVGRNLSKLQNHECHLPGNRIYSLRIVRSAEGSVPAIYQIIENAPI